MPVRGPGNYVDDGAKGIARLKKELWGIQDVSETLKKAIGILENGQRLVSLKPWNVNRDG